MAFNSTLNHYAKGKLVNHICNRATDKPCTLLIGQKLKTLMLLKTVQKAVVLFICEIPFFC